MNYPKPLRSGSIIAVTAFSAGIEKQHQARFDLVKTHLESLGFRVVVGNCLHGQVKHVSAPIEERVDELMQFLLDDSIDAIFSSVGERIRHGTPPSHRLCQIAKCSTKVGFRFL